MLAVGLAPLVAATAAITSAAGTGLAAANATGRAVPGSPIRHVIEIMIENHTFDNLFGAFRGADGIPADTLLLNPNAYYASAPGVRSAWATRREPGLGHDQRSFR